MEENIIICDRCGQKANDWKTKERQSFDNITIGKGIYGEKKYDLCEKCIKQFKEKSQWVSPK